MLRNSQLGFPGSMFIRASFSSFFSACLARLSSRFFWMRSTSLTTLLFRPRTAQSHANQNKQKGHLNSGKGRPLFSIPPRTLKKNHLRHSNRFSSSTITFVMPRAPRLQTSRIKYILTNVVLKFWVLFSFEWPVSSFQLRT